MRAALLGAIATKQAIGTTPASFGAVAWYNPELSYPSTADGTVISALPNLISGQTAWDLAQATSGARPVLKTGVSPGGKRGLRFDGVDDFMRNTGTPTVLTQPRHIFCVAKVIVGAVSAVLLDGASNHENWLIQGNATLLMNFNCGSAVGGVGPDHTSSRRYACLNKAGSLSSLVMDGTTIATGDAGSAPMTGLTLGGIGGGSSGFFANVEFYDIFIVPGEVTGATLTAAYTYQASAAV